MNHALIVGAGIAGLSTAWALVRRGWTVTILERGPLPNPLAASSDHHRLIRWHYSDRVGYAARMGEAFAAWDDLWSDLGTRHYVETGVLALSTLEGDWTEVSCRTLDALGIPHERLSVADAIARFPHLDPDLDARFASFTPTGGALMANRIMASLADWLRAAGGEIHTDSPVTSVDPSTGSATTADGTVFCADTLVVSSGVGAPAFGLPGAPDLVPTGSTIVYVRPPADLEQAWEKAPCWVDLGGHDDLWGIAPVDGLPAKLGMGILSVPGDPETERVATQERVARILGAYRGKFRSIERFSVETAQRNFYATAPEGRFVLKRADRAVLLSADSGHGFKFGALTGLDAAEAIAEPDRFESVARRMAGLAAG